MKLNCRHCEKVLYRSVKCNPICIECKEEWNRIRQLLEKVEKKQNFIPCQFCGELQERTYAFEKATCYSCKMQRDNEYSQRSYQLKRRLHYGNIVKILEK